MATISNSIPKRFYSLDAIRGIAALSVVLWHWQHFYYNGTEATQFAVNRQPLYYLLYVFYEKGGYAVDLFFSLSGFVFFWLYAESIKTKAVSIQQFVYLRFSRLYPLHFLTLIAVCLLQLLYKRESGGFFVYPQNNLQHFILQTLFISNGESFNGPTWSISIELLIYIIFFIFCLLKFNSTKWLIFLIFIGLLTYQLTGLNFGRGLFSFFIGGLVLHLFEIIHFSNKFKNLHKYLIGLTGSLIIIFLFEQGTHSILNLLVSEFGSYFSFHGKNHTMLIYYISVDFFIRALLFPLIILTLVLYETKRGHLGKRLSILGDLTYSSYLLHFPLQLIFVLYTFSHGLNERFYDKPGVLALFFALLIVASYLVFNYIELPLQRFLRNKLFRKEAFIS